MISGRNALHRIDASIADARRTLARVQNAAGADSSRLATLERAESECYRSFGALRLDILQTDENVSSLGAVDGKAERLIETHEQALADLSLRVETAAEAIEKLETERRRQEDAVDATIAAHEKAVERTEARLADDPKYGAKADALEEANAIAERAAQKLEIARADRETKGAPYESDPLFSYLWRRNFGTKEYRAFFLFAALDRWVASLIKYRDVRLNYMRLLELPERLAEHAERVKDVAAGIEKDIEVYEREALEKDGVTKLRDKAAAARTELERIDAAIANAEQEHETLAREHRETAAGEKGPLDEARALLARALQSRSIPDLRILAAETTTLEDDRIVDELIRLKRERLEIEENRHALKSSLDRHGRSLSDLEKLRRQFKTSKYDSPYSEFSDAGIISVILSELMRGALSYGDAWRRLSRAQKTRRRNWQEDFGGDEWRDGFGLPQKRGRDWSGSWGGGWTGGRTGGRLPSPRAPRAPRIPRAPRLPRRGGGKFRTGGGF